ncbi:Lin1244/Lin1753 domain-containing protein [Tissierella sp.]|uniref:Lin1244/Lin1753 domain-containing protein n=1 Tax=Tissierella sp. TaxID=41274 RepID=UPI00285930B8|nr:Lin1244/Lin1753 domain-containing protein [Tissierella sp.]MDR7856330.1 DUF4373 domain-containing protein [Tissierella sp.]
MARPQKVGLDYFPLDTDIDQDDKVAIIEAQHGMVGFSIVIKLLMKIYNEGYYYDWTDKEQILFSKRVNVDINEVNVIINDCVKWGLFDERLFNEHKLLTSSGIQKRYFEAVKRRQKVEIAKEFLLLDEKTINAYSNLSLVSINDDINQDNGEINVNINPQSKVNKTKVNDIKEKEIKEDESILDKTTKDSGPSSEDISKIALSFQDNGFGSINGIVKEMIIELLELYSTEWILGAMKIAVESNKRSLRYVKGILENWNRSGGMKLSTSNNQPKVVSAKKNRFHNFEQRSDGYTAEQLEDVAARKRREYSERTKKNEAL